jgi:hypothetical protein
MCPVEIGTNNSINLVQQLYRFPPALSRKFPPLFSIMVYMVIGDLQSNLSVTSFQLPDLKKGSRPPPTAPSSEKQNWFCPTLQLTTPILISNGSGGGSSFFFALAVRMPRPYPLPKFHRQPVHQHSYYDIVVIPVCQGLF